MFRKSEPDPSTPLRFTQDDNHWWKIARRRQALDECPHCDPYPVDRRHRQQWLDRLLAPLAGAVSPLRRLLESSRLGQRLSAHFFRGFFRALLALRILRPVEARDDDEELSNRTLVVVREARTRGIAIHSLQFLGQHTNFFTMRDKASELVFEGLPTVPIAAATPIDVAHKGTLKQLLGEAGLPHPKGRVCQTAGAALQCVHDDIGFPVVVKPVAGSLSQHTTCNITSPEALAQAVRVAQIMSRQFIVEQFIKGDDYRVTMVDGRVVAACRREPPNVVGDGISSIQALIEQKNQDPRRGELGQRNRTLHQLTVNRTTRALLESQQLTLASVPAKNQTVYLHRKVILAAGADIHDVTDEICPANRALFERVATLCQAPLIGIDVIARSLATPPAEQPLAILEVNSLPYIDMHHYPVTGRARNVAGAVLDAVLSKESRRQAPQG